MIKPVISILIVNWNTKDITLDCLRSVYADPGLTFDLTKPGKDAKIPAELILVDNASTDGSVNAFKKLKHPLTLIENKQNVGFGKANNQAFARSTGNYILYLNSDTVILHGAVSQALNWLSSHPEAGICTGQLLNRDKTVQMSGGFFPNLLNMFTWCTGLDDLPLINSLIPPFHPHTPAFYTHDRFFLTDHRQDWVTGAFMLTRRELISAVNGFNDQYFMYGEELELSYRIHKKFPALSTWYLVGPQVIHLGGASAVTKMSILEREYQGIITFFGLHHPRQLPFIRLLIGLNKLLRGTIYQLFQKDV